MFKKSFWKAAAERALKSGAQFVLLVLGVGVVAGTGDGESAQVINAFALDYVTLAGAFGGGVLVSVLTSIVSHGITKDGPSLTHTETIR